ncbi:MAG: TlpA disulfide reductase family protein, partial [Bacteroidales bacterium]|nr:TlpA disulfide reductase family protein [Bacteroidales bacterium]
MFKRLKTIIVFLLLLTQSFAQEKKEKDYIRTLQTYIDSYLESVPPVTDSLIAASDYLIAFSDDSLIRSHITGYLYNKFRSSLVMGMESVAVYIGKEYYLNGRVKPANEDEKFLISLFVRLNENSLIGMKAPELRLPDQNGDTLSLRNLQSTYTLVYFYDDKCSRCKTELPVMKEILRQFEFLDISVYAVYTQASGEDFKNSAGEILSAFNDISGAADTSVKWHFVCDPGFESGFHLLYNVLSTPQLFLLDKDQKIIGRNLESRSLRELLSAETARLNNLSPVTANFLWSYLPLFN